MPRSKSFGRLLMWTVVLSVAAASTVSITKAQTQEPQLPPLPSVDRMLVGLVRNAVESPPAGTFSVSQALESEAAGLYSFRFGAPWNTAATFLHMRLGADVADSRCWIYYQPGSATLWRYDPPLAQGPMELGLPGQLTARGCHVDVRQSYVTATADVLVVTLQIHLRESLIAPETRLYMQAQNDTGRTDWIEAERSPEPVPDAGELGSPHTTQLAADVLARVGTPATRPFNPSPRAAQALVSLTPTSGSGAGQTFEIRVGQLPVNQIQPVHLLIQSGMAGLNACWIFITQNPQGGLAAWLYNDSVTQVAGPVVAWNLSRAENSQCVIGGLTSSINRTSELVARVEVAFKPGFAGAKKLYVLADNSSAPSGWIEAGTWNVSPGGAPMVVSREPFIFQGASPVFRVRALHTAGYQNLTFTHLLLNNGLRGENACWAFHHQPTGSLWLYNDAATGVLGPVYPGAWGVIENSYCQLSGVESWVSGQGLDQTVGFQIRFKPPAATWCCPQAAAFPYLWAADATAHSGWVMPVNYYVSQQPVKVVSGGFVSGGDQKITASAVFDNPFAPSPVSAHILVQNGHFGTNACWVYYEASSGRFFLSNDTKTTWSPGIAPGSSATAQNSQCVLNGAGSSVVVVNVNSSQRITMNVNLTIKPAFNGPRQIWAYGVDAGGQGSSGWAIVGQWSTLPSVTSVAPNTGQQGQANLAVAITGVETSFAATSQVSFGEGVIVNSVTVADARNLTANISIAAASGIGPRTVRVTTGAETVSLANGFTVTPRSTLILSSVPRRGRQGQSLSVAVAGHSTHFVQGLTQVSFDSSVAVSSVTVVSSTSLTVSITIAGNPAVGTRTLTVTTGTEVVTFPNAITILPSAVDPISAVPLMARQGESLTVALTGNFANATAGSIQASFGEGISVGGGGLGSFGPVTITGSNSATAALTVAPRAAWTQVVASGALLAPRLAHTIVYDPVSDRLIVFGGTTSNLSRPNLNDVWRLNNVTTGGAPSWVRMSPTGDSPQARAGHTAVYDSASDRMIVFGGYHGRTAPCNNELWILANASERNGLSQWTRLSVSSPPPARWGHRAVYDPATNRMIVNGGGNCNDQGDLNDTWVLTNANGLGGTPAWSKLSPATVPTARYYPTADYDPINNRLIIAGDSTDEASPLGVWVLTNANGLGGSPEWTRISSLSPAPGGSGVAYDPVSNTLLMMLRECNDSSIWALSNANGLGGQAVWRRLGSFPMLPRARIGAIVYDAATDRLITFGGNDQSSGIPWTPTLSDTWILNAAARGAGVGPRTVRVRTPTETTTLTDEFTVTSPINIPVAFLDPACVPSNQSAFVTLSGEGNLFLNGDATAKFDSGIAVGGGPAGGYGPVSILGASTALAQVTVGAGATVGQNAVSVRVGSSEFLPASGFTVAQSQAENTLTSVTPRSAMAGSTVVLTVTSSADQFLSGLTTVALGPGMSVSEVTVENPRFLYVTATIAADAVPGPRPMTVMTGGNVAKLYNAFVVVAPPTL